MQYVEKLCVALRQSEQAHRNLRLVQGLAGKRKHLHLEQGTLDLAHRMAQLTSDLRTLIGVVHSQVQQP